ncbi:MAG: GAF domain-containing protein, partial [Candidatus Omnitrophota bacterium]
MSIFSIKTQRLLSSSKCPTMESEEKSRLKIGTLCSVIFIVISYLVFRTRLPRIPNIFLYNLVIIIALQGLGFYRGLFFLGSAIFLTCLASIALDFHCAWNLPIFVMTFLIVKERIKLLEYYEHIAERRLIEVKENTNLLSNEYARHKREAVLLEKKEQRYSCLKDVTSILSSTLSLNRVTELVLENAFRIVGKTECLLLFLVDTKKQELNLAASKTYRNFDGVPKTPQVEDRSSWNVVKAKKGDLLDEWVFKQRKCLLVEDIRKDFRFTEERITEYPRSFRSVIACPLMEEKKVRGVVRLEHPRPYNYTSEDLRLLDILCDLGAASLQNARFYRQTLDLAITDGLTGLY